MLLRFVNDPTRSCDVFPKLAFGAPGVPYCFLSSFVTFLKPRDDVIEFLILTCGIDDVDGFVLYRFSSTKKT